MKKYLAILFLSIVIFSSCDKELDEIKLDFNPYDKDYIPTSPFMTLDSVSIEKWGIRPPNDTFTLSFQLLYGLDPKYFETNILTGNPIYRPVMFLNGQQHYYLLTDRKITINNYFAEMKNKENTLQFKFVKRDNEVDTGKFSTVLKFRIN